MVSAPIGPIAGHLPRIAPDECRASRIAFDARFHRWVGALMGQGLGVARQAVRPPATVLDIEAGEGSVRIALDPRGLPAMDMALALDDDSLACEVASALLAPWLGILGRAAEAPRVVRRAALAAAGVHPCIATPAGRIAVLGITAPLALRLGSALAAVPAGALHSLGALALTPRLVLLRRLLPTSVLLALQAGDIVLLEGGPQRFTLTLGKGRSMQANAMFDPDAQQATLASAPTFASDPAGPDDAASLDELQVPVSFEVDSARITLAELASMRPGYVIELERPLDQATVRLVCHGQTVGHGQLLAVGSQMGIRIVQMGLQVGLQMGLQSGVQPEGGQALDGTEGAAS